MIWTKACRPSTRSSRLLCQIDVGLLSNILWRFQWKWCVDPTVYSAFYSDQNSVGKKILKKINWSSLTISVSPCQTLKNAFGQVKPFSLFLHIPGLAVSMFFLFLPNIIGLSHQATDASIINIKTLDFIINKNVLQHTIAKYNSGWLNYSKKRNVYCSFKISFNSIKEFQNRVF